MLQNGQEENLKKVNITLFPFIDDMSKIVPSMAGRLISGAGDPISSFGMNPSYDRHHIDLC
jgi:hypothetical protein